MSCGAGARRIEKLDTADTVGSLRFVSYAYAALRKLSVSSAWFELTDENRRGAVFCAHSAPGQGWRWRWGWGSPNDIGQRIAKLCIKNIIIRIPYRVDRMCIVCLGASPYSMGFFASKIRHAFTIQRQSTAYYGS